jgi:hypothetical protein
MLNGFHAAHERMYSFALRDLPVEIVTLRVDAIGMLPPSRCTSCARTGGVESDRRQPADRLCGWHSRSACLRSRPSSGRAAVFQALRS